MVTTQTSGSQWSVIVERAQNLEPDAFDAIVEEFAPRIRGYVRRFVPISDVDDLVQEVFLRMVRSIKSYRDSGKFEAWLFQIARNLALDHVKKYERGGVVLEATLQRNAAQSADENEADPMEGVTAESIEVALRRIPQAEREVILLRHFGRLQFDEIARIMGTPLGTALARAHRGLSSLRKMLEEPQ